MIRIGAAQAGFSLLILAASIETVVYVVLTALSFPLYLGNNKPHFSLELLKSSSFTMLWAIWEIYRGCYITINPLIDAPTRESFARKQLEPLAPCLLRRQDRAEIIKQMLPHSSKNFIDFCIKDDIWIHLRHNIFNLNHVLSALCRDLDSPNSLDVLKELHITNLCKISYAERELYFLTIKLIKEVYPNLLQLHLENVQKICTSDPSSLRDYLEFIKNLYLMTSPMPLESKANLDWINNVLQEINTLPLDLKKYLIDQKNEISVSITFNQTQEERLETIIDLGNLGRIDLFNQWIS